MSLGEVLINTTAVRQVLADTPIMEHIKSAALSPKVLKLLSKTKKVGAAAAAGSKLGKTKEMLDTASSAGNLAFTGLMLGSMAQMQNDAKEKEEQQKTASVAGLLMKPVKFVAKKTGKFALKHALPVAGVASDLSQMSAAKQKPLNLTGKYASYEEGADLKDVIDEALGSLNDFEVENFEVENIKTASTSEGTLKEIMEISMSPESIEYTFAPSEGTSANYDDVMAEIDQISALDLM